jgi:heme-degrading monooxygenase HmoA
MEVLVATLAHTTPGKDAEGLARIRLISDTVRNAPGLVGAQFYRSRGLDSYYFILTTWEDQDLWNKARKRYNPRQLILGAATELLTSPPEQWYMRYLWGYSRPSASPILASAHLATLYPDQGERAQRAWVESLRRQVVQPMLAFAFLARGSSEHTTDAGPLMPATPDNAGAMEGSIFLNFLSWASETEREEFYEHSDYQAIARFLSSAGTLQVLALDPLQ